MVELGKSVYIAAKQVTLDGELEDSLKLTSEDLILIFFFHKFG